jgi:hypothetical protein
VAGYFVCLPKCQFTALLDSPKNFCSEALARLLSTLPTSAEKLTKFCREVVEVLQRTLSTSLEMFSVCPNQALSYRQEQRF